MVHGGSQRTRVLRPRTILYGSLMVLLAGLLLAVMLIRRDVAFSLEADRNPFFVRLSDGGVRDGYWVKILNKRQDTRSYALSLSGLPSASLSIIGMEKDPNAPIIVPADTLRSLRVFVSVPSGALPDLGGTATSFQFQLTELGDGSVTKHAANFRSPQQ